MTFTYAVIADSGIVLVADSQITSTHSDKHGVIGTYKSCRGKIKRIGARFAFSVAGDRDMYDRETGADRSNEAEQPYCTVVHSAT